MSPATKRTLVFIALWAMSERIYALVSRREVDAAVWGDVHANCCTMLNL